MDVTSGGPSEGPERGAAVIAGLTLASRGAGLVRNVVAVSVLGVTFLGNTYASTNSVPNLLFEIMTGGALAAVLVPVLSGPHSRGNREETEKTASALLTRAIIVATPVVVAGLLLRGPLMVLLTSRVADPRIRSLERDLGELLLLMFLPQIWLYGIGVVLTGVLHTYRRFGPPALAPLLSSVVVTASYLLFAASEGGASGDIAAVSARGKLILGLGTTAGVVVLSFSLLPPLIRMGFRIRPALRLSAEASSITRRLVTSAVIAVGAQQALLAVVLVVANGVEGGVVAYQLAFTLLLFPWAVLVLPVATAHFPLLSEAAAANLGSEFADRCADAARSVAVLAFGGAAVLGAAARPLSRALSSIGLSGGAPESLIAGAVAGFAPGIIGYGGYALLTRVAFARGDGRSPALGALAGFGSAAIFDIGAAGLFRGRDLVVALAAAFSAGMLLGSLVLAARVAASAGRAALAGLRGSMLRGLVSAGSAGAAGWFLSERWHSSGAVAGFTRVGVIATGAAFVYVALSRMTGDRQMTKAWAALRDMRGR